MDEEMARQLLALFPGSRKAAQGIIVDLPDGGKYQIFDVHSGKALEGLDADEYKYVAFCSRAEILRLRELRSPHDYLLRIRAEAISRSPRAVRVMMARKKNYSTSGKPWSLTNYYHQFDAHHKSYLDLLPKAMRKTLANLPAGLVPIAEPNAICMRSLAGDVIVASEALAHFFRYMSIGLYGGAYGVEAADALNGMLIAMRLMNGVEAMDFDIDPREVLPAQIQRNIERHVKFQLAFTFGHEFAHLIRGHLALPDVVGASSGDAKAYDLECEFEADLWAIRHASRDARAQRSIVSGGFETLLFLHFLETAGSDVKLRKHTISDTHPSALDRIWRLWANLAEDLRPDRAWLEDCVSRIGPFQSALSRHVSNHAGDDLASFYGSIYLPSFSSKSRRDRVDC
jgi:hypothetical protein